MIEKLGPATIQTASISGEEMPLTKKLRSTLNSEQMNKKPANILLWLDWISSELKPFSSIENEKKTKYTNLTQISRNISTKYLHLISRKTEKEIAEKRPEKFALGFNGCTLSSMHYIAIFAI